MKTILKAFLVATAAFASSIVIAAPAHAETVYRSDECSSSTRCFGLMYNSMASGGYFYTGCFLTNKTEYSHTGYQYSPNGVAVVTVRYQFGAHGIDLANGSSCTAGSGMGESPKNNAAGGSNTDSRSHRVYYNTGFGGAYQTIESGHNENLSGVLYNQNASSERL